MASLLEHWREKLIPWQEENELEIFSLNLEKKQVNKRMMRVQTGAFFSIYNEPMMTFAYRDYSKGLKNTLIFARTLAHQFVYRAKTKRTDVFIDGQHACLIAPNGIMYGGRRNQELGKLYRMNPEYYGIEIWGREVAHLRDPATVDTVNPRAFEIMEEMNDREELLFLAFAFLKIILHTRDD